MKNKENIFCEYTIKSWDDCRKLLKNINTWVFRGQSNSDWGLQTSLERGVYINDSHPFDKTIIEEKIIEKFQRRAYHYLDKQPEKKDLLEWLSLIQHHGGPTRLLDFSYSYYVSLFFSIEQALQESALFCLNKDFIFKEGAETEKDRYPEINHEFGTREYCNEALNEQIRSPLIMLIEPFTMHERLSKQQGLFAIPFEGRQSFEYNLSLTIDKYRKELPESKKITNHEKYKHLLNQECALLKIKIPKEFHKEIRKELKLMNITNETLLPGIDGFAKSLYNEFDS